MTVYVPQEILRRVGGSMVPAFDITPAAKFGGFEFLLPSGQVMLSTAPMVTTLKRKLKDFCDDDYILDIGDGSARAAAVMVAAQVNRGHVRLLKWDKRERQYLVVDLRV